MEVLKVFGVAMSFGCAVGLCLVFGLKKYIGGYLDEKAKNLATKEDVGEITGIVEGVKKTHARELAELGEAMRAQTSLRFLAADRRLEVHQKAYAFVGQMMNLIHSSDAAPRRSKVNEMVSFWNDNCLYMDAKVREAFAAAMRSFDVHRDLLDQAQKNPKDRPQLAPIISANFETVKQLESVIISACELPSIAGQLHDMDGAQSR